MIKPGKRRREDSVNVLRHLCWNSKTSMILMIMMKYVEQRRGSFPRPSDSSMVWKAAQACQPALNFCGGSKAQVINLRPLSSTRATRTGKASFHQHRMVVPEYTARVQRIWPVHPLDSAPPIQSSGNPR